MTGFGDAIKLFFKRYTDFQGRSSRAEYWWIVLFNILLMIPVGILFVVLGGGDTENIPPLAFVPIGIALLYGLVILIPSIALAVRRFHDINQTGWLYLIFIVIGVIPLIGLLASLVEIVLFCLPGTKGPNKYGEDPYGNAASVFD